MEGPASYPPLNFFYSHFHNSIKAELELLVKWVQDLDAPGALSDDQLQPKLLELRERYRFLEQVYKYHSSVEDEVVYPALDSKVKNVTVAYRVEHQYEELLFEQLAQLISNAISHHEAKDERTETIRGLICKVEEIHRTLKKHLAKEEEQLLPLLLKHFTFPEQAELVAQFLYCIPLATVERVLAWLKPMVPKVEQEQLLQHIRGVVPDNLLLQLLTSWLQPDGPGTAGTESLQAAARTPSPSPTKAAGTHAPVSPFKAAAGKALAGVPASTQPRISPAAVPCVGPGPGGVGCIGCPMQRLCAAGNRPIPQSDMSTAQVPIPATGTLSPRIPSPGVAAAPAAGLQGPGHAPAPIGNVEDGLLHMQQAPSTCPECGLQAPSPQQLIPSKPPIKEIIHIHRTICSALEEFAREARLLQQRSDVTALQLASLVERHRFLRSVCMFHTISEEEVLYPEVRRIARAEPALGAPGGEGEGANAACSACEVEHESEVLALEDLGRLLADVRAFARRGRKEVSQMLERLSHTAEQVCGSIAEHMAREEAEVFPLLERHLCATQQRAMVWRTLRAMPLRLLEKVMPWVTATLSDGEQEELLNNMRLGAPAPDTALVELLARWAERGRRGGAGPAASSGGAGGVAAGSAAAGPSGAGAGGACRILTAASAWEESTVMGAGSHGALWSHPPSSQGQGLQGQRAGQPAGQLAGGLAGGVLGAAAAVQGTNSLDADRDGLSSDLPMMARGSSCEWSAAGPEQSLPPASRSASIQLMQQGLPVQGAGVQGGGSGGGAVEAGGSAGGAGATGPAGDRLPQQHLQQPLDGPVTKRQRLATPQAHDPAAVAASSRGQAQGPGEGVLQGRGARATASPSPHPMSFSDTTTATHTAMHGAAGHLGTVHGSSPAPGTPAVLGQGPAGSMQGAGQGHSDLARSMHHIQPHAATCNHAQQHQQTPFCCYPDSPPTTTAAGAVGPGAGSGAGGAAGLPVPGHAHPHASPSSSGSREPQDDTEQPSTGVRAGRSQFNPIDHIFQFHQALRQELRQLESDALQLEQCVLTALRLEQEFAAAGAATAAVQQQQPQQPAEAAAGAEAGEAAGAGTAATTAGPAGAPPTGAEGATAAAAAAAGPTAMDAEPLLLSPERCSTPGLTLAPLAGVGAGAMSCSGAYATRLPRRVAAAVQTLDGRFKFLWGIYRAHSRSEDEIVFPALESKHALRNVSHAYTLDHQQEEQLFIDMEQVMEALRRCPGLSSAREHTLSVRRMCAAVRASLETHIRAEEAELWPLFTEHFSTEEQQYLVGVIIGRTGAQVLQAMLPWITDSFSLEEKEEMMGSLRQATRNTMFDQWLEAVTNQTSSSAAAAAAVAAATALPGAGSPAVGGTAAGAGGHGGGAEGQAAAAAAAGGVGEGSLDPEVARYLHPGGVFPGVNGGQGGPDAAGADGPTGSGGTVGGTAAAGCSLPGGQAVESSTFRPGWEDIFRMNQKQLEAAVMRVSADPNLEPGRKSYLIQNIMVSKYIVAQQRRMRGELPHAAPAGNSPATAADGAVMAGGTAAAEGTAPGGAGAGATGPVVAVGGVLQQQQGGMKTYHDAAKGILGCKHYRRRAQLVAPCCNNVFTCRLCHDEAVSHRMDRYAVSEMCCMECGARQPVRGSCGACGAKLARYYCGICHLFDDEPGRDIYHCPFCNVCRRGRGLGIDFFHCMTCNSCMSLSLFKTHKCRERAMEANCPVCNEYLFDSADPIKELPCAHFMHSRCFAEYTRYNYTCPLCSKSVGDMSVYFQMLDSLLASEQLPPEYAGRMQQVLCNDCGKQGFARFHFAYHACPHCRSYNTRLM